MLSAANVGPLERMMAAAQAKDFTDRFTQLQTSDGDQEEKFQDFVAGWVEEQSRKRTAKDDGV